LFPIFQTLQYHYHPDVFKIAKKVDVGIGETNLTDKFELSANDVSRTYKSAGSDLLEELYTYKHSDRNTKMTMLSSLKFF